MFTTIALAATQEPLGVFCGASLGHATICVIAVHVGTILSEFVGDRALAIVSGIAYLTFAALVICQILISS